MTAIQEKHNEVFEFLMKKRVKNPDLRFTLRQINRANKLKKGYWFYGTDDEIYISFWNAWFQDEQGDNKQLLSIMFCIKEDGSCRLALRGGDKNNNTLKDDILGKIANNLGLEQAKGKRGTDKNVDKKEWYKVFEGKDYLKHLEQFIDKEKKFIDSSIELWDTDNTIFPFITEEKFVSTLAKLKNWQIEGKEEKEETIEDIIRDGAKMVKLRIENIKRFSNASINLDAPVVCFYGENGMGKTTLLRAIAIAIAGSSNLDKDAYAIKKLPRLERIDDDGNEIFVEKAFIELGYTVGKEFTKDTQLSFNPITFKPNKENENVDIEENDTLESGEENANTFNLHGNDGKKTFKTLMIGFPQQNISTSKKLNGIFEPNFEDLRALVYEEPSNNFDTFIEWIGLKLAPERVANVEERQKNREQINQIFKVISQITLDDLRLSDNALSAIIVTKNHPSGLPLYLMSQGFKNIIGWIGILMKRLWEFGETKTIDVDFMQMPAVCLIDEIDTYLHPEWQYRILSVLVKNFKNVQFIVTSHSPFVLSSIPNEDILIHEVKAEDGEIVVELVNRKANREASKIFYGAEMNEAATQMRSTKRFKEVDEKVDKLFELIYDNKLDKNDDTDKNAEAVLLELKNTISPNSADLLKAQALINTKKQLRQRK